MPLRLPARKNISFRAFMRHEGLSPSAAFFSFNQPERSSPFRFRPSSRTAPRIRALTPRT